MLFGSMVGRCEEIALATYAGRGLDPLAPPSMTALCRALFECAPEAKDDLPRESLMGVLDGRVSIFYRPELILTRRRFCIAHEIAHALLGTHHAHAHGGNVEAEADCLAACLLAPLPAWRAMIGRVGHSVYDLAHAFSITQSAALLRLGETEGRPVRLLGDRERVRGEAFDWPDSRLALAGRVRHRVHPVQLRDERKWGLIATRAA